MNGKTTTAAVSTVLLLLAAALLLHSAFGGGPAGEAVRLGYCPTMKLFAETIASKNSAVKLVEYPNSAEALKGLKLGQVEASLIGRIAKKPEFQGYAEKTLSQGYTLVSSTKRFIDKSELPALKVHTAVNPEVALELLPGSEVVHHDSLSEAISKGLREAVLIDWGDFNDDYELLVVLEGGWSLKALEFRTPVVYSTVEILRAVSFEI